jgi:hypothetical protein
MSQGPGAPLGNDNAKKNRVKSVISSARSKISGAVSSARSRASSAVASGKAKVTSGVKAARAGAATKLASASFRGGSSSLAKGARTVAKKIDSNAAKSTMRAKTAKKIAVKKNINKRLAKPASTPEGWMRNRKMREARSTMRSN